MTHKNRIDIFCANPMASSRENYCSRELEKAFDKLDIAYAHVCLSEGRFADYLPRLHSDPPSWTLSFEPLFEGLGPPHLYWADSLPSALQLRDKEGVSIACHQPFSGFHSLPDGVSEVKALEEERSFDLVLFDPLIDCAELEKTWKDLFEPSALEKMYEIVSSSDPIQTVLQANSLSVSQSDLLFFAKEYLRAKKVAEVVDSFGGARVDLFGEHVGNNWLSRLKNRDHIHLHWSLSYADSLEVLKQSKILVADNESPWFLPALAAGCLVVEAHEAAVFLASPQKRIELVKELQAEILPHHSWEKRAQELITIMEPSCVSIS